MSHDSKVTSIPSGCESLEEAVNNAQTKVDAINRKVESIESDLSEPGLPPAAEAGLKRKLAEARERLSEAEKELSNAQAKLDDCIKGKE